MTTSKDHPVPSLRFECEHRYADGFVLKTGFVAEALKTALIGPSGSGKTSVLNLIAGLLRPHTGKIVFGDRVLCDSAAGTFVPPEQRRIGYVFQEHRLFPHLTVAGNLAYARRRAGSSRFDEERLLELLELKPFLQRAISTLSGGQQRRVAIGRALLTGPELLLLDEPLTGLDDGLRTRIIEYLNRIVQDLQIPTILVSHDLSDVRKWAEQTIALDQGAVLVPPGTLV